MRYYILILSVLYFQPLIYSQNNVKTKIQKEISHDLDVEIAEPVVAEPVTVQSNPAKNTTIPKGNKEKNSMYRKTPQYELRGVWVSTVQRVDFPTQATTDPSVLKTEWLNLLQFYKSLNLNAVIVQVRPTGDAIYPSKIVPYSKWLTGKSGKSLNGNFDLLKFMIESAHTEGMEFHAWINPYRVIIDGDTTLLDPRHPVKSHPNWIMQYGREYMLNPGIPSVWKYLTTVVGEIVSKYDIDAVHFDDYFYPYRIAGEELPDSETFKKYGKKFNNIEDWRRANTDSLMWNIRQVIKKYKPQVQLGVSPFAVWRNANDDAKGSNTKAYQRCYDDLYADVLYWMKRGWLDYVAPEIYFNIGHPLVDYKTALEWWQNHSQGTTLYISHAMYKVNHQEKYPAWSEPNEIPRQLDLARSKKEVKGLVFFSSKWLIKNELGVTDSLRNYFFYEKTKLPNIH